MYNQELRWGLTVSYLMCTLISSQEAMNNISNLPCLEYQLVSHTHDLLMIWQVDVYHHRKNNELYNVFPH